MDIKILNPADLFRHEPQLRFVPKGECLFQEGERGNEMYVQMSGCAQILVKGRVVEKTTTGAILGEMALIDQGPRAATVVATSDDCRFAVIETKRFSFMVQQTPNFALHVMRVLASRLRHVDEML